MGSTYLEGFAVTQTTDIQLFKLPMDLLESAIYPDPTAPLPVGEGLGVVLDEDGEPWFVAQHVAAVLGISNSRDAVSRLDVDEYKQLSLRVGSTDTAKDQRVFNVINEAGLYSLTLTSRRPQAKAFKRWVTHEVLPSIRKTGAYAPVAAPKTRVELARELLAAEERTEMALAQVAEQRALLGRAHGMLKAVEPKVEAYDALQATDHDWSMRDAAAILNRDPEIWKRFRLGQNGLFRLLREFRMVDNANHVYAAHKQHLRLLPMTYPHPHTGEPRASEQLRLTAGGLVYLQKRLGGTSPDALHLDEPNEPMPV